MRPSQFHAQRLGELHALGSVFLWSLFPFMVHRDLNPLPPLYTAALSTFFAVPAALAIMVRNRSAAELRIKAAWRPMLAATLLVGVLFYGLLFYGTRRTSPVNMSLLSLMEVVFSFMLLSRYRTERVTKPQALGSILMVCGAIVLLAPSELQLNAGDVIIIIACAVPPFGNYFAKQARLVVQSEIILLVRSVISGVVLLFAAILIERPPSAQALRAGLPFVVLNGILVMGLSKILWTEALHRLPIPKAVSTAALVPALTMILSFAILHQLPTLPQLAALLPICAGMILLTQSAAAPPMDEETSPLP